MNPLEYQKAALITLREGGFNVSLYAKGAVHPNILHAAIGLGTESGEFLDNVKKSAFFGLPFDRINAIEELGDLLWYVAIACETLGTTIPEVMEKNICKLQHRYPNRKSSRDYATNRDLEGKGMR